jgi:hypothetical protein
MTAFNRPNGLRSRPGPAACNSRRPARLYARGRTAGARRRPADGRAIASTPPGNARSPARIGRIAGRPGCASRNRPRRPGPDLAAAGSSPRSASSRSPGAAGQQPVGRPRGVADRREHGQPVGRQRARGARSRLQPHPLGRQRGDGPGPRQPGLLRLRQAAGGNYAARLHLVELPACALTTPRLAQCRKQKPIRSVDNVHDTRIGADVRLPGLTESRAVGGGVTAALMSAVSPAPLVLAATAAASGSGSAGNFGAEPLSKGHAWVKPIIQRKIQTSVH